MSEKFEKMDKEFLEDLYEKIESAYDAYDIYESAMDDAHKSIIKGNFIANGDAEILKIHDKIATGDLLDRNDLEEFKNYLEDRVSELEENP